MRVGGGGSGHQNVSHERISPKGIPSARGRKPLLTHLLLEAKEAYRTRSHRLETEIL